MDNFHIRYVVLGNYCRWAINECSWASHSQENHRDPAPAGPIYMQDLNFVITTAVKGSVPNGARLSAAIVLMLESGFSFQVYLYFSESMSPFVDQMT